MAQPTSSDDQAVRRRLSHNNLRRKQWRRRLPRAGRKRPRRSGNSSALTFGGARIGHPIFLSVHRDRVAALRIRCTCSSGVGPRSEVADIRPDVPGGRVRRMLRRDPAIQPVKGGTPHGEESEGRKEEGGEEEVRSLLAKKRGASGAPFFLY